MIKIEDARAMVEKAKEEKNNFEIQMVKDWLDGTVSEVILARAKEGVNYVNVTYPKDFIEAQKTLAQILLANEGYEIDPFFVQTLEIRF